MEKKDKPGLHQLSDLKNLFPDMENYVPDPDDQEEEEALPSALSAKDIAQMKLYVSRDKKNRGGKQVTLVQGHEGPDEVLADLLSKLKSLCSSGGSFKDGELILQGDHVKKVMDYLIRQGYKQTKQKGG